MPAAKRRWGYYVLPLLYGDRFVGRIEPRSTGRRARCGCWACGGRTGSIRWIAAHPGFVAAFAAAALAHAAFAGLTKVALPRTARHRAFLRAVRERL